jgi:uncharacterized protein YrrD
MERGSYMLLEHGMTVRGTDGDLGTVAEVVADENADIFRGFTLTHGGLFRAPVFVPGDRIVAVENDEVRVNLSREEAGALAPVSS